MTDLTLIQQADKLYKRKKYPQAKELYEQAIRANSADALAHQGLGVCYFTLEEKNSAQASLEHALEIDPNLAKARAILGAIFFTQDRYTESIEEAHKAIQIDSNQEIGYFVLGLNNAHFKNLDSALTNFRKALELRPGDYTLERAFLGTVFEIEGPKAAIREIIKISRKNPEFRHLYYLIGYLFGLYKPGWRRFAPGIVFGLIFMVCAVLPLWLTVIVMIVWGMFYLGFGILEYQYGDKQSARLTILVGSGALVFYLFSFLTWGQLIRLWFAFP